MSVHVSELSEGRVQQVTFHLQMESLVVKVPLFVLYLHEFSECLFFF